MIGADIFAEAEEGLVTLQIFDGRSVALIDFDLFDARIALDVEDAVAREQVGIEFLGAADVENGVGLAVKLADSGEGKAGGRIARQITRAKTPPPPVAKFRRQMLKDTGGVIEFVVYLESLGVVGKP